jgi:diguanylate cyclase (GGDEF)-like protein/PAS domain S-box-containing protein
MQKNLDSGVAGLRVLIVEDEALIAEELYERLTRLGMHVVGSVDSADLAVYTAAHARPDLVMMDIRLRGERDGVDAAAEIQRDGDVPVVYVTSHADRTTLDRAMHTAPFGYVLKPFREQELLVAIEMAVSRHSMERRLRQSERKFVATLASIGDGVIATDVHGRVTFMNPVAEALTAWPFAEARDQPVDSVFRVTRGIGGQLFSPVSESLAERRIVRFGSTDLSLISRTNETIPIDDCVAPIVDDEGHLTGSVVAFRDVRDRCEHERQRNYLASIVECSEDAIIGATLDGRITTWNSGAERLYGYTAAEAVGQHYESLFQGQNADALAQGLRAARQGGRVSHFETVQVRKNGDPVDTSMTLSTLPDRDGTVTDVAMIVRDISQQKRFEARLQYLADHDPLTGLLNRRRFGEEVERQLAQASRYAAGGGAVLVLDLDEFKQINDTLGHSAGDEVIRAVAMALSERMRETDVIARIGGDEFVVLLVQVTAAEARLVASDLIDALPHPFVVHGTTLGVTASIGVAVFEHGDQTTVQELLGNADLAMYEAKTARNQVVVYSRAQGAAARRHARPPWIERIRTALRSDGLTLHYQPIQDLCTGTISQWEALVRMVDDNGLIAPRAFLGCAEQYGLVEDIDRWVVRRTIQLISEQLKAGRQLRIEVNLSGRSLGNQELPDFIRRELAVAGIDPTCLILEITETVAIANLEDARTLVKALTGLGCGFALDDFGAGFSSFSYLKYLPVNYVKIDGEFIRSLSTSSVDQAIVRGIVGVAKELRTKTVAEFVGDAKTIDLLRDYGVDFAQGFKIGEPQTADSIWQ